MPAGCLFDGDGSDLTPGAFGQVLHRHAAGLEAKWRAYTSLKAAKSPISARKQVVLTTRSKPRTAASGMAPTFWQLCSAWAAMPWGTVPPEAFLVSGTCGSCGFISAHRRPAFWPASPCPPPDGRPSWRQWCRRRRSDRWPGDQTGSPGWRSGGRPQRGSRTC